MFIFFSLFSGSLSSSDDSIIHTNSTRVTGNIDTAMYVRFNYIIIVNV